MGEFAIGVNPYILKPMKDILFDEKIMGSIHLTPGNCYDECAQRQRQRHPLGSGADSAGGIRRRRDLVRRSPDPQRTAASVIPELECLNPEKLI